MTTPSLVLFQYNFIVILFVLRNGSTSVYSLLYDIILLFDIFSILLLFPFNSIEQACLRDESITFLLQTSAERPKLLTDAVFGKQSMREKWNVNYQSIVTDQLKWMNRNENDRLSWGETRPKIFYYSTITFESYGKKGHSLPFRNISCSINWVRLIRFD